MRVTVLGTGTMGAGMVRSLLRGGHDVTVWNRTPERAEPLAADGARVATSAPEAVAEAEVVVTVLFDTVSVLDVMAAVRLPEGCVWLQSATIGVDGTERAAGLAHDRGWRFLDAPVLGTKQPAEQGALVVLAAGDEAVLEAVRPVTDAIGSRVVRAGSRPGDASRLKLVCNAWVASLTAAVGQSVALAEGLGVDPQLFLDAIEGGAVDTPYAHVKGAAMIAGDYPASFTVDGVAKDLGLIREAALSTSTEAGLVSVLLDLFDRASEAGHGADDMAAVRTAF